MELAENGKSVCLVLDSLVTVECKAFERLASLITFTSMFRNKSVEVDEEMVKKNLRIAFILDENKFDSLIPHHLVNHFVIIHAKRWSKKSVEQSLKECGSEVFSKLSSIEYSSTTQLFQVKRDFNKIHKKRNDARKQQLIHLTFGLSTLEKTAKKASELNVMLSNQRIELDARNEEANEKLDHILSRQQLIQRKQEQVEACRLGMEERQRDIHREQEQVHSRLTEIEPVIRAAKEAVASINKLHLAELRSMCNPPDIIKQVLEAVCLSLGHEFEGWREVQSVMKQDDFIHSILNSNTIHNIERVSRMELSMEAANRASKACGPLLQWLESQIKCTEVSMQVKVFQDEIARLAVELENSTSDLKMTNDQIVVLKDEVDALKQEYDLLTRERHQVQDRIQETRILSERARRVIDALNQEHARWKHNIEAMAIDNLDTVFLFFHCPFYMKTLISTSLHMPPHPLFFHGFILTGKIGYMSHGLPPQYTMQVSMVFNSDLPVIYDPEGIFTRFIQSMYSNKITLVDMNERNWHVRLKQSIALDNKILLHNFVLTSTSHHLSMHLIPISCVSQTFLILNAYPFEITSKTLESICTYLQLKHFNPEAHAIYMKGCARFMTSSIKCAFLNPSCWN